MKIITLSREFGSGGRELGKRLADALGMAFYDREILTMLAQQSDLDETYVERALESGALRKYPFTFSRTLSRCGIPAHNPVPQILAKQHKLIEELAAGGDCVIVGRGADAVLAAYHPFKLFVYAEMSARIERCRNRAELEECLSDRELERRIRQIDNARAENHNFVSSYKWGDKGGYHLCINTTGVEIQSVVSPVAMFARTWFERREHNNGNTVI